MSFERAIQVFLPQGIKTQQYRFSRDNSDGSKDNGNAYVHHGPHNLSQFRSYVRTMPNGTQSLVEDVIYISSHANDKVHWTWFNNLDEAWVGEQSNMGENGLVVNGYGLVGRNAQNDKYQKIIFTARREGDKVFGLTRDGVSETILSDARYEPVSSFFDNVGLRISEHFGFPVAESSSMQAFQMVVMRVVILYALMTQKHDAFLWGLAVFFLVGAVGAMQTQRWNNVIMYFVMSTMCAAFASKHSMRL